MARRQECTLPSPDASLPTHSADALRQSVERRRSLRPRSFRLQGSDGYLYAQGIGESCGAHCVIVPHIFRMSASGRLTGLRFNFTGDNAVHFLTIDAEGADGNVYGTEYLQYVSANRSFGSRHLPRSARSTTSRAATTAGTASCNFRRPTVSSTGRRLRAAQRGSAPSSASRRMARSPFCIRSPVAPRTAPRPPS